MRPQFAVGRSHSVNHDLDNQALSKMASLVTTENGLAVYMYGVGDPVLVMPTPHACTPGPEMTKPLAQLLIGLGRRVITFDPPGAFRSTRGPRVGMQEMIDCAAEAIDKANVRGALTVCGHSMASLCAIGFALSHPDRTSRLLLVGTMTGPRAALTFGGMPRCWNWRSVEFWAFVIRGLRLSFGIGNLRVQQQLCLQTMESSYYLRPAKSAPPDPAARSMPASPRVVWARRIRDIDYSDRLKEIGVPTLVCAGRHDPQTTPRANQAVADGIPRARIVMFEQSGHYPFEEQRERFSEVVEHFLSAG